MLFLASAMFDAYLCFASFSCSDFRRGFRRHGAFDILPAAFAEDFFRFRCRLLQIFSMWPFRAADVFTPRCLHAPAPPLRRSQFSCRRAPRYFSGARRQRSDFAFSHTPPHTFSPLSHDAIAIAARRAPALRRYAAAAILYAFAG